MEQKVLLRFTIYYLYSKPQVLLVEIEKAEAFIQKNKSSFDIMGEVTSTAKKQRRTNKWMKVVYHTQGGSVNIT